MTANNFDPIKTELLTGINLIEASAGTGKTYAIAMLVLRFVVENDVKIEQLLVVTFTKAATEELKDRIRARLAEAKQAVNGRSENIEANVLKWLASLKLDQQIIRKRLEHALLNIDQASIFTIHGFCQRILSEHALESGQLFDFELTGEIAAIKQFCTDDFWRREIYTRSPAHAALLTTHYPTPNALLNSINNLLLHDTVIPKASSITLLLSQFDALKNTAYHAFPEIKQTLISALSEDKFKGSFQDEFEDFHTQLEHWLQSESAPLPSQTILCCLSYQSLYDALNGHKFRKNKSLSSEERKSEYLSSLALNTDVFDELVELIQTISVNLRVNLAKDLAKSVDTQLQRLNLLSFDDLINRLSSAIINDKQQLLVHALQQRFKVALIDEFQDTDHEQWTIFSNLFTGESQSLYLIGDPKQAIYKFRGADIFSYFAAQQQAQHHFTLGHNWRSHPQLVSAMNQLFKREEAFLFTELAFNPVAAAKKSDDGFISYKSEPLAPMMLWQLGESDSSSGHWTSGKAATEIKTAIVNEILSLLNDDYSFQDKDENRALEPKDIAILVRSNRQAKEYQTALNRVGIPAVLNSIESVFSSEQANELFYVLQAIAEPENIHAVKQALTLDWFALTGQQFYQLINDEIQLNDYLSRFSDYHKVWQEKGLMTMMQQFFETEHVFKTLAKLENSERILTNLQHLIELLQQTAEEFHLGVHKILAYLAHTISTANNSSDEQQLRLESDADAVKIVTMHRSKGLEYFVVFCPCLWQNNEYLSKETALIKCYRDGQIISDLGSKDFEKHREFAIREQSAEDLRILYVAVTRAKYRCYVAWANVRSNNTPNQSALAYLLEFAEDSFTDQQQILQRFRTENPSEFDYQLLEPEAEVEGYYQPKTPAKMDFKARSYRFSFETHWQMSSYTALASLSLQNVPDIPLDKAQELEERSLKTEQILALPKGSHTGNVIHSLLEYNSFEKLADPELDISAQRDKTCLRYGLKLEQPEVINQLLQKVVSTPLSADDDAFCLKNLKFWQCIKEMPFYLAVDSLQVEHINFLLAKDPTFQALSNKRLAGYLTGFIDLVCEYNGRYYVVDYKSNFLENYQVDSLIAAMSEHNYGLQYWLYSLVLHLYLQNRLPDYNYQQHFGGVRYLFVRGMEEDKAMSGVYSAMPDLETLNALAHLFSAK